MGYVVYSVKPGDNVYDIANEYKTSVERIIVSNPNINIYSMRPGTEIIVSVRNVVNTQVSYSSEILEKNIRNLKLIYPFLEVGEIGKSVLNKSLPSILRSFR